MRFMCRASVSVLVAGAIGVGAHGHQPDTAPETAFVDVTLIRPDRVLPSQTVLIRGDRIVEIGPSASVRLSSRVRQVDGRGRFLMPGIADMHVHLRSPVDLLSYLMHGVTTVANLGGAVAGAPDILGYKRLIAGGALIGPTIYTTGPLIDGSPLIFPGVSVKADSPEEADQVVQAQKAAGYDMIKIYQRLKPDVFDALMSRANAERITAIGHVPQTVTLQHALASGMTLVTHGTFFLEPLLDAAMASYDLNGLTPLIDLATRHQVAVMPTMVAEEQRRAVAERGVAGLAEDPEAAFLHPSVLEAWRRTTPAALQKFGRNPALTTRFLRELTRRLSEAGVLLLLGTDAPAAMPGLFPGRSAHDEIRLFVESGLTPLQALAVATDHAGRFVRRHLERPDSFGRIEAGYRADLLLLARNPAEDVANSRTPVGVMVRGHWYAIEELTAIRAAVSAAFRTP